MNRRPTLAALATALLLFVPWSSVEAQETYDIVVLGVHQRGEGENAADPEAHPRLVLDGALLAECRLRHRQPHGLGTQLLDDERQDLVDLQHRIVASLANLTQGAPPGE